jgi:hypothetical protein
MSSKRSLLFQIGTFVLAGCAVLNAQLVNPQLMNAQLGSSTKLPNGPHNQRVAKCTNCVRDVNGQISQNPAPVRKFRSTHPCPANKSLAGSCPGYVVDFKKPLDRGGKDAPENMRWRTLAQVMKKRS